MNTLLDTAQRTRADAATPTAAKPALWVFMGVVTVLFAQFLHAYIARLGYADWQRLPTLPTVWLNTALLILSSGALQWAYVAGCRAQSDGMKAALLAGGGFAFAFLTGQLWLWQQLNELDYVLTSGPASSFFYLLTGLHGLHLLGGLAAWAMTTSRIWQGLTPERLISLQLCVRYWHFLLALWLVLFGMLFLIPPATILAICSSS